MTITETTYTFGPELVDLIKPEHVEKAYLGRAGACCCGCAGTYVENPSLARRRLNAFKKSMSDATEVDWGTNYVAAVVGKRIHIMYFTDEINMRRRDFGVFRSETLAVALVAEGVEARDGKAA